MKLQDFVVEKAIVAQLKGVDRDTVIRELVDALIEAGAAPRAIKDELIKLILDREKHGSTGFGKGVAVPHVKHDKIKGMAAAIGCSAAGVDFNALDKAPVYSVFLLLSPKNKPDDHLHAMENIFSNLQKDTFRRFLRQAATVEAVLDLIQDADSQQIQG
ncbi:MAG: PTS sugar transporter subunit IIA [Planctomycetes bacterium]|nr:PTS sugar transporter subunit IIA [Planctomycetota bacterium]